MGSLLPYSTVINSLMQRKAKLMYSITFVIHKSYILFYRSSRESFSKTDRFVSRHLKIPSALIHNNYEFRPFESHCPVTYSDLVFLRSISGKNYYGYSNSLSIYNELLYAQYLIP